MTSLLYKIKLFLENDKDCLKDLTTDVKKYLLQIPVMEVRIDGKRSPLMNAVATTTTSLYRCYAGETRKLIYPEVLDV